MLTVKAVGAACAVLRVVCCCVLCKQGSWRVMNLSVIIALLHPLEMELRHLSSRPLNSITSDPASGPAAADSLRLTLLVPLVESSLRVCY